MVSNAGYALLIGVDDYSSHGAAPSLQGSREDVLKLYWFARVLLGLPPENIRVLASPPFKGSEFYMVPSPPPAETMGEATQAGIQGGIEWLAGAMQANAAAPGLLTFSGHGSYSKDLGSVLCPSDIGADLSNAIPVRDLSKNASLQKVRDRLTVVLDCCHVVGDAPASNLRATTAIAHDASADEVAGDWASFDISDRVLLAARLGQPGYQALLGKVYHGALTFALVTVAEQWKASEEPGSPGMHVSYKQLHKRVKRLLWSLRMKQNVQLRVPEAPMSQRKAVRSLPFFGTHAGTTTRKPDAPRTKIQTDPGMLDCRVYTLTVNSATVAQIYVPAVKGSAANNTNNPTLYRGIEFWYVTSTAPPGSPLSVTWTDYLWADVPAPPTKGYTLYTVTQTPSWFSTANTDPAPSPSAQMFVSPEISSPDYPTVVFYLAWDLANPNPQLNWYVATTATSKFSGTVFTSAPSSTTSPPMPQTNTVVFRSNASTPAPPSGSSWSWYGDAQPAISQ